METLDASVYCMVCNEECFSLVEQDTKHCIEHMKSKTTGWYKLANDLEDAQREIDRLKEENKNLSSAVTEMSRSREFELEGQRCGERGLGVDQCPYKKDSFSAACWLSGWADADLRRRIEQLVAVLDWSSKSLPHIIELADGYGMTEVSEKIKQISEKLAPFGR